MLDIIQKSHRRPSRGLSAVEFEQAAEPLLALDIAMIAFVIAPRNGDDVAQPLVIPLFVKMRDVLGKSPTECFLAEDHKPAQVLNLHREHPALRERIQIGGIGR